MTFDTTKITDAKRLVRGDLYWNLKRVGVRGRVLLLPGRTTEELTAACAALPRCDLVAIDSDPEAAAVAQNSDLADEVVCGKVEDYRRRVTFANLDFCGQVPPRATDGRSIVTKVASRVAFGLSVFVSYGRDAADRLEHFRERSETDVQTGWLKHVPKSLFGRVASLFEEARLGLGHPASLVRVYRYAGNHTPMLGIVVLRGRRPEWHPGYFEANDGGLPARVLREIDNGAERKLVEDIFAARGRAAAFRAVRTMKRRC